MGQLAPITSHFLMRLIFLGESIQIIICQELVLIAYLHFLESFLNVASTVIQFGKGRDMLVIAPVWSCMMFAKLAINHY
jgi:hypothetical protein